MPLGILAGFLAACFGWQIDLIAIQRGLKRGRVAAFLVGCGAILADSGTSLRSSMLLSSPRMSAQFGSGPQAQSVVPEPTSLGLVGLSAIGMLIRRRRVGR